MRVSLNGKEIETAYRRAFDFKEENAVIIRYGYQLSEDCALEMDDEIFIIPRGSMPKREDLEAMMAARHTPGVHQKLKTGRVAVAGVGGLGSHVAVILARMGIGSLLLVDFDVVEPSNLNRQHYMVSHLGSYKTEALKAQLAEVNPFIDVATQNIEVTLENAVEVFAGYPIVVEAFDNPTAKADLVEALLAAGNTTIVAASGLAGLGSANAIQTRRRLENLYIAGDLESAAGDGMGLMAPRVYVCAGHQANMVVRLLIGEDDV
jgi:sulfur carrier protein ThiS adenylyltransferase